MNVGKRITFFRTAKNYSVNKLATLSGISQSYLRDIELGNKNPTIEILSPKQSSGVLQLYFGI